MMRAIDEKAVSEVIGVVLLLLVAVLGVAIVAVTYFSQPAPSEIPHVSVVAGATDTIFVLSHEGGDALAEGSYRIYVDNGSGLEDRTDEFILTGGGAWSIGENLTYTGTDTPERVVISAVDSGGGEMMIAELADVADMVDAGAVDAGVADAGGYVDTGGSGSGSGPTPEQDPEVIPFIDYVINESVFVYGSALKYSGDTVTGPGATVIITGNLNSTTFNEGASIAVSQIYIDGDVTFGAGSASLGSSTDPGYIYINGDLTLNTGRRDIYGNVYVNGSCDLEGVSMYDKVYVNGDLTLRRSDTCLVDDARIYYTGTLTALNSVSSDTLEKCIHQTTVPGFTMPDLETPSVKSPDTWYTSSRGYVSGGTLTNGVKIFADNYSYTPTGGDLWAENVVVIARDGDIDIGKGGAKVTGVFFAPNGKMTFHGDSLEGVVIARDGFFVTSGGTDVTFRNINEYITNSTDYPF
ncbi:MAG: type IV pilin [Methanoculleus sp.]